MGKITDLRLDFGSTPGKATEHSRPGKPNPFIMDLHVLAGSPDMFCCGGELQVGFCTLTVVRY